MYRGENGFRREIGDLDQERGQDHSRACPQDRVRFPVCLLGRHADRVSFGFRELQSIVLAMPFFGLLVMWYDLDQGLLVLLLLAIAVWTFPEIFLVY